MNLEILLEKKEQLQLELLKQLISEKNPPTLSQLGEQIRLSRPSLELYLEDLQDWGKVHQCFQMIRNANHIYARLSTGKTFDKILGAFVKESIKYNLLCALLEKQALTITSLSAHLMISESTLFRKIKELNILLKPFDLVIKNNQMNGEESQIRYFYYLLWQTLHPNFRPSFLSPSKQSQQVVNLLEETLRVRFSPSSQAKINCWLRVADQRKMVESRKNQLAQKQKSFYQDNHLYQLLDSVFYQSIYEDKVSKENYETIIFFEFLISFYILSREDYYRFYVSQSQKIPVVLLDIAIRERALKHYQTHRLAIEEEKSFSYQLSQVNNRFYFFKGTLSRYQKVQLMDYEKNMMDQNLQHLLKKLLEIAQSYFPQQNGFNDLEFGYTNMLLLLEVLFTRQVTIAYDLSEDPSFHIPLEQLLKSQLRSIENISIEPFNPDKSYDLLVSNQRDEPRENVYLLDDFNLEQNLHLLTQKIELLKQNRLSH